MKLEGIHHITAITGDAPENVEFYAGVLGLRMVKKSVNQDDPTVYHLFYGDDEGSPGLDLTFFEYPGASPGAAGAGMIHRILWRVGSADALEFWEERLADAGTSPERTDGSLRFADPEGLDHELLVVDRPDPPLSARAPDVPVEHAIQGFEGVRAYTTDPARSEALLRRGLGFESADGSDWEINGDERHGTYHYDPPPTTRPLAGGGTVHHIAFATQPSEHERWQQKVAAAGARPTPVIDRFYFKSIYFREPSGVLFELATIGPGFAVDEDADKLGERLALPPNFEHLRGQVEQILTPLPDPWKARAR